MSDKYIVDLPESDQAILDYLGDLLCPAESVAAPSASDRMAKTSVEASTTRSVSVEPVTAKKHQKTPDTVGEKPEKCPGKPPGESGANALDQLFNSSASMLGRARKKWLAEGLAEGLAERLDYKPVAKTTIRLPAFSEAKPPKLQFSVNLKFKEPYSVEPKSAALKTKVEVATTLNRPKSETLPRRQKTDTPSAATIDVSENNEASAKRQPEAETSRSAAKTKAPGQVKDVNPAAETPSSLKRDTGILDGHWLNGRPEWAQEKFECLLFHVSGLKLAVPLVSLGGIYALDAELTPLFGMPKWLLGLFPHGGVNMKVVDSALWVMPERYSADWLKHLKYVVRLHDSEWGLACDNIAEAFTLDPDNVKWRGERSKRPWLAGTVVNHMCALIDVSGFRALLEPSQGKRRAR